MQNKLNRKNEKLRRNYEEYLREYKGASEKTINMFNKVLRRFNEFYENMDFTHITKETAIGFKKKLELEQKLCARTIVAYIHQLKKFFEWLGEQEVPRKQKIKVASQYLNVSKDIKTSVTKPTEKEIPDFEEIKKLFNSIIVENEVDKRDKALIAFLLCSGIRIKALITLPLKSIDIKKGCIKQFPSFGVETKFSKSIETYLFNFYDEMIKEIIDWATYLKEVKHFEDDMPLFPKNKLLADDNNSFIDNKPWEGESSVIKMLKKRFEQCGIAYYSPHRFRDLTVKLGLLASENALQVKAVSQNLGHEHVATTLSQYGTLRPEQLNRAIKSLNYKNVTDDFNKWTDYC